TGNAREGENGCVTHPSSFAVCQPPFLWTHFIAAPSCRSCHPLHESLSDRHTANDWPARDNLIPPLTCDWSGTDTRPRACIPPVGRPVPRRPGEGATESKNGPDPLLPTADFAGYQKYILDFCTDNRARKNYRPNDGDQRGHGWGCLAPEAKDEL